MAPKPGPKDDDAGGVKVFDDEESFLAHLREIEEQERAITAPDDLSDLDGIEDLFTNESEKSDEGGRAEDAALPFGELPALAAAAARDRLGYHDGLKGVLLVPDRDQWNAAYVFAEDGILIEGKFAAKADDDKVRTLLHELGHRGQVVDAKSFEEFKRLGLGSLPDFLAMANKTHLEDFERTGKVDGREAEAFAESYARACLGMEMPEPVAEFWRRRFGDQAADAKVKKESVDYVADWGGEETACRRCSMFRWHHDWPEDNRCTLVRGDIDARGHCRRWASALANDAGPPDEARDPAGKWTKGGGGSASKKGLTAIEKRHVKGYSRDDAYKINDQLRAGGKLSPDVAEAVRHIDSAIAKSTLHEPTTLYRSLEAGTAKKIREAAKAGKTSVNLRFPGYTSTTMDRDVASGFADDDAEPVMIYVDAPAGQNGLYTGFDEDLVEHFGEEEVILPRGLRLKANLKESSTVQMSPNGIPRQVLVVEAKIIPSGAAKDEEPDIAADWSESQHPRNALGEFGGSAKTFGEARERLDRAEAEARKIDAGRPHKHGAVKPIAGALGYGGTGQTAYDEWEESKHPRGQPENKGEFAPKGEGGSGGGGAAPEEPKPDIRKSMNAVSKVGPTTQPVGSLDELYERARAEEPAFKKMVEDIAGLTGSTAKFHVDEETGSILKERASSERKLRDELDGDFTRIRDVLRGTVIGDSVEKTRATAATFIAKQGDNILRIKDRHVGPEVSGYRDILVNFRTPGGLVAELQFNSKAMAEAKKQGHQLYDQIRKGGLAGATLDELQQKARAIYDKAYLDDGDGHWGMEG